MVVGQFQAQVPVDLKFVGGIGRSQDRQQSAEAFDHRSDFFSAHPVVRNGFRLDRSDLRLHQFTLPLHLPAPQGDEYRVGSGFECSAMAGELLVVFGQGSSGRVERRKVTCRLRVLQLGQIVFEVARMEHFGQPRVDRAAELIFAQVYRGRMVEIVGQGVLGGIPTPVVGFVVVPSSLHTPLAAFVEQQSPEGVGMVAAGDLAPHRAWSS
ncbi:hypothetical protein D7D52_24705 [Nocardia yunnanensis]|uniref:Uncharacterized protein n=1 Tax=Nocardia yunnanensis TaxID=2382165 RepID=A0A386ZIT6_9NOCA|nr:hypothetical protein [Nocardia yunnanensis]AYF76489.1 hypothetical protein D7D52_24705 [Nocardia yunnanensis]